MFEKIFNQKTDSVGIDINSVNEAKEKAKENLDNFNLVYTEALLLLKKVLENPNDKESLKQSILKLTEATKIKENNPEPYYYLSYISYICKDFDLANKYLDVVEFLDPNFLGLSELRKKLSIAR